MSYKQKKAFFDNMLTIYGRKAVEEALLDTQLPVYKLHLADSNRPHAIIDHCLELARQRGIEIAWHDRRKLSFISKNARQDQGIALDIALKNLKDINQLAPETDRNLLLLDNITNPQNIGMIIRNVAAGFIDGVIIPRKGCAELGPLVIKASSGSLFKATIYRCDDSAQALDCLKPNYQLAALMLDNTSQNLYQYPFNQPTVFVLGNESTGVSSKVANACNKRLYIPMNNQVESLNVAVTSALLAFHPMLLNPV